MSPQKEEMIRLMEIEKLKQFEKNLVEAIVHVSWMYNKSVEEIMNMTMPHFRILLTEMNKIRKEEAIIMANQIGKLFGGKGGSGGMKTFG